MACLYRHIRKDLNIPFYIGIGNDIRRAYSKSNRNIHWLRIVSKTDYEVDILFDDISYDFAKEKEIEFIALYKRKQDGGILCNITKGGDGVLGLVHTEESRRKMSEPNKGKTLSEWHKKRISELRKGKPIPEETRRKMSESVKGEKNHMYGKKASEETRRKMVASAKRGESNSSSKLTKKDVLKIRILSAEGMSARKIAKKFNVNKGTISCIIKRITWRHV